MNILYVANSINMYGANRSLMDFLEHDRGKNIRPVVLLWDYGAMHAECIQKNIKVYVLPFQLNAHKKNTLDVWDKIYGMEKNVALLSEAKKIVEDNHIELIHSNASNVDFGAMLAMACHLPHVWHIRELLREDYALYYDFPWLTRLLMHRADQIISISGYVADCRKLPADNVILYDGINIEKYFICKKSLFCDSQIRILYAGIISHNKGTMDAVRAVRHLVNSGHTNIVLMIAGGKNGYWNRIEQYIAKYDLQPYIRYYGYQSELRGLREQADIAIMSSRCEALGRVTIESMLGEVLVIGASRGATPELIQDGVNGYLYEPGNISQLADKILRVYQDREKSRIIVKNAKRFARREFDVKNYANHLLEIYKNLTV